MKRHAAEPIRDKKHITIIEQKTKKKKSIYINDVLKKVLNNWIKNKNDDEFLFTCKRKDTRLNKREVSRFLEDVKQQLNIEAKMSTHTMRKTFGYHHYKQFKDTVILQKIFNHSNLRITLIYIGVEQDEIDESYKEFAY